MTDHPNAALDSSALTEIKDFLTDKTVGELPEQKEILEIDADVQSPLEAFQLIVSKGFLSAPAYTVDSRTGKKKYIGFLDTRNLVAWAVFAYDDKNTTPSLSEIIHHGIKKFAKAMDGVTVSYLARSNPMKPVKNTDTLLHALELLSARGCHRIPVLNEEGNVSKLITQYTIIEYLYKHRSSYAGILKSTISDLGLGKSPVVSVINSVPTIQVFQKMEKNNLSGIAVLNEEGRIIGATSGSDLKLFLNTESRSSLDQTIMQFLNSIRQESLRATVPVLVCEADTPLSTVLAKLAATREHRIFVIDGGKTYRPVRVISLSDILESIVKA